MKNLNEYILESLLDDEDVLMANADKEFKTQIKQFLKETYTNASKCRISKEPDTDGKYIVNSVGKLEVKNKSITSLTNEFFKFGYVEGQFICTGCNNLTSLEGAPIKLYGSFNCSTCHNLTSLVGAPEHVGGDFLCRACHNLTSLEGAPKMVGESFYCDYCPKLTSLEGAPKYVNGSFYCGHCGKSFTKEYVKAVTNQEKYIYC